MRRRVGALYFSSVKDILFISYQFSSLVPRLLRADIYAELSSHVRYFLHHYCEFGVERQNHQMA